MSSKQNSLTRRISSVAFLGWHCYYLTINHQKSASFPLFTEPNHKQSHLRDVYHKSPLITWGKNAGNNSTTIDGIVRIVPEVLLRITMDFRGTMWETDIVIGHIWIVRVYWECVPGVGSSISEFPVNSRFGVWKNLCGGLADVCVRRRVGKNALLVLSFYISIFPLDFTIFFLESCTKVSNSGNMIAWKQTDCHLFNLLATGFKGFKALFFKFCAEDGHQRRGRVRSSLTFGE